MNITDVLSPIASVLDNIVDLYQPQDDLETTITQLAMRTVVIAGSALIVLTIFAILFSNRFPVLKLPLFVLMSIAMAGSTLTLIGSTVYLNTKAESAGPIHWHADTEFWACGNQLEFRDPTGTLSNKIGTAVLHEHNDQRIHLEGVVVEKEIDASLGKFMHVAGGAITDEALVVPLNADGEGELFEDEIDGDGPSDSNASQIDPYIVQDEELGKVANFRDGDTCGQDVADVQTFVYRYNGDNKTYEQTKIEHPQDFVMFEDPNVPPGDCVIFEFGPSKEKTDKLCEQYGIRDIERCEQFGVTDSQREICELTQTNYDSDLDYTINQPNIDATEDQPPEQLPEVVSEEELTTPNPCEPYFDTNGNPTGIEVTTNNADGTPVNPDVDCVEYAEALRIIAPTSEVEVQ